jgi:hypothetical protein
LEINHCFELDRLWFFNFHFVVPGIFSDLFLIASIKLLTSYISYSEATCAITNGYLKAANSHMTGSLIAFCVGRFGGFQKLVHSDISEFRQLFFERTKPIAFKAFKPVEIDLENTSGFQYYKAISEMCLER